LSIDTRGAPKRRQGARAVAGGGFKNQADEQREQRDYQGERSLGAKDFDLPGSSKREGEMGETGRSRKHVRVARGEEGRWKKSGGLASPSPAAWPWRSLSERCVWREKRREAEAGGENMLCPATARRLLLPPPVGLRVGWFVVAGFALCLPRTEDGRRGPPGPGGPHQTTGIPFEKRRPFPVDFVGLLLVKED
jgi:hypothetical protein